MINTGINKEISKKAVQILAQFSTKEEIYCSINLRQTF